MARLSFRTWSSKCFTQTQRCSGENDIDLYTPSHCVISRCIVQLRKFGGVQATLFPCQPSDRVLCVLCALCAVCCVCVCVCACVCACVCVCACACVHASRVHYLFSDEEADTLIEEAQAHIEAGDPGASH